MELAKFNNSKWHTEDSLRMGHSFMYQNEISIYDIYDFLRDWSRPGLPCGLAILTSQGYSDQMSQRSQVSRVGLCMSKVKVLSVTKWSVGIFQSGHVSPSL